MMHMTFYWGTDATILFQSWKTTGPVSYVVALLLVALFGVLHEALTSFRVNYTVAVKTEEGVNDETALLIYGLRGRRRSGLRLAVGSCLYALNAAFSYVLMLIVMTFNLGLCLAVVAGHGIGYQLFGYGRPPIASADVCCVA